MTIIPADKGQVHVPRQPLGRCSAIRRAEEARERRWTAKETALGFAAAIAFAAVMALL